MPKQKVKLHNCKKLKGSDFWFEHLEYREYQSLCADNYEGTYTSYQVNYCPMCGKEIVH